MVKKVVFGGMMDTSTMSMTHYFDVVAALHVDRVHVNSQLLAYMMENIMANLVASLSTVAVAALSTAVVAALSTIAVASLSTIAATLDIHMSHCRQLDCSVRCHRYVLVPWAVYRTATLVVADGQSATLLAMPVYTLPANCSAIDVAPLASWAIVVDTLPLDS